MTERFADWKNKNQRVVFEKRIAMPEWLSRDDRTAAPWTVVEGAAQRGEAFTDLLTHRMQVPVGADETSRCIRAHELMHAKVSPTYIWVPDDVAYISLETMTVAEEFRINMLVEAAGFPVMKFLADGSEKRTGERLAQNNDWNSLVHMTAATVGTKAFAGLISGVKSARPEWVATLREVGRQMRKMWREAASHGIEHIASTEPWDLATTGWAFTVEIARFIHRALINDTVEGEVPPDADSLKSGTQGIPGKFAPVIELALNRPHRVDGRLGRRKRPTNVGRHPRHLDRLLTDPQRRVFDHRKRGLGGVVLIDQSGSMRLTDGDLWRIIEAAPGCVIIGYSHEPRSQGKPNLWVLADRGQVVDTVPVGNGGNGVDGPALLYALRRRKNGEPMLWVCDGHVTDETDDVHSELTEECARIVALNHIHQVPDVESAVKSLTKAAKGEVLKASAVGPIAQSQAWRSRMA